MRDSVVFYRSFYDALRELPAEDFKAATTAVLSYALDGIEPQLSGMSKAIFTLIKPQIDANNKRYENGKRGGRPTTKAKPKDNQTKTKAKPKDNQTKTKTKPNVNDNVNVNVNDNVNVNVNDNVNVNTRIKDSNKDINNITPFPSLPSLDDILHFIAEEEIENATMETASRFLESERRCKSTGDWKQNFKWFANMGREKRATR